MNEAIEAVLTFSLCLPLQRLSFSSVSFWVYESKLRQIPLILLILLIPLLFPGHYQRFICRLTTVQILVLTLYPLFLTWGKNPLPFPQYLCEKTDINKVFSSVYRGYSAAQLASTEHKCLLPWQCHRLLIWKEKGPSELAGERKWKGKIMKAKEMSPYDAHEAEIYFGSLVAAQEVPQPVCVKVALSQWQNH